MVGEGGSADAQVPERLGCGDAGFLGGQFEKPDANLVFEGVGAVEAPEVGKSGGRQEEKAEEPEADGGQQGVSGAGDGLAVDGHEGRFSVDMPCRGFLVLAVEGKVANGL